MKWYGIKKFQPTYEGWYIVRYIDDTLHVSIKYLEWSSQIWYDYDENDSCFKGNITHFLIPEPVETDNSICKYCGKSGEQF